MSGAPRSLVARILSAVCLLPVVGLMGAAVGFAEDRVYILGMAAVLVGVGAGVAAGFQLYFSGRGGRLVTGLVLAWTSVVAIGGLHGGRHLVARATFDRVVMEASQEGFIRSGDALAMNASPDSPQLDRAWERHLEEEVGSTGWCAPLQLRASLGLRVLGSRGLETDPWLVWFAWFLEWVVVVVTVMSVTYGVRNSRPGGAVRASEN
jgi:hypothetical protein